MAHLLTSKLQPKITTQPQQHTSKTTEQNPTQQTVTQQNACRSKPCKLNKQTNKLRWKINRKQCTFVYGLQS